VYYAAHKNTDKRRLKYYPAHLRWKVGGGVNGSLPCWPLTEGSRCDCRSPRLLDTLARRPTVLPVLRERSPYSSYRSCHPDTKADRGHSIIMLHFFPVFFKPLPLCHTLSQCLNTPSENYVTVAQPPCHQL